MRNFRFIVGAVLCLPLMTAPANAISVTVNYGNLQYFDECEGGLTEGGTWLWDYDMPGQQLYQVLEGNNTTSWGPGHPESILAALASQYPGWNYSLAYATLQGTLYIDWYKAIDVEGNWYVIGDGKPFFVAEANGDWCRHGAQITTHYVAHESESTLNLDWIQLYYESGGSGSDFYKVDGYEAGDTSPAYFTPADNRLDFIHIPNPGGLIFGDSPGDYHLESEAWSGGVEFTLLLAAFDTEKLTVTLYDALEWGYVGRCVVPAPLSVFLGALGLVAVAIRKTHRSRHVR